MDMTGRPQFILNGRWLFDEDADQLTCLSGAMPSIRLKPIVTRLFGLLVRAPSEVLSRRRLMDEGWRRHGFEVCDNSLSQAICSLRAVLETLGSGGPLIKTIPRIGYALLADVREESAPLSGRNDAPRVRESPLVDNRTLMSSPSDRDILNTALENGWDRARRCSLPLSLLLIDVDPLGDFRDPHGRLTGGDTPASIVQCIRQNIHRTGDSAGRYDHRVAVLLSDTDERGAAQVAERIRASLYTVEWQHFGKAQPGFIVSIGIACTVSGRYDSAQALLAGAVATLNDAKNAEHHCIAHVPFALKAVA